MFLLAGGSAAAPAGVQLLKRVEVEEYLLTEEEGEQDAEEKEEEREQLEEEPQQSTPTAPTAWEAAGHERTAAVNAAAADRPGSSEAASLGPEGGSIPELLPEDFQRQPALFKALYRPGESDSCPVSRRRVV